MVEIKFGGLSVLFNISVDQSTKSIHYSACGKLIKMIDLRGIQQCFSKFLFYLFYNVFTFASFMNALERRQLYLWWYQYLYLRNLLSFSTTYFWISHNINLNSNLCLEPKSLRITCRHSNRNIDINWIRRV